MKTRKGRFSPEFSSGVLAAGGGILRKEFAVDAGEGGKALIQVGGAPSLKVSSRE